MVSTRADAWTSSRLDAWLPRASRANAATGRNARRGFVRRRCLPHDVARVDGRFRNPAGSRRLGEPTSGPPPGPPDGGPTPSTFARPLATLGRPRPRGKPAVHSAPKGPEPAEFAIPHGARLARVPVPAPRTAPRPPVLLVAPADVQLRVPLLVLRSLEREVEVPREPRPQLSFAHAYPTSRVRAPDRPYPVSRAS